MWAWPNRLALFLIVSAAVALVLTAFSMVAEYLVSRRHGTSRQFVVYLVITSLALGGAVGGTVVLAGLSVASGFAFGFDAALHVLASYRSPTGRGWMIVAVALLTAIVGGAFFVFRLKQRFVYGATETLAGMVIAGHRVSIEPGAGLPSETGFYLAVLTAGIYLVVRGLDNMHQAAAAGDPFFAWVKTLPARLRMRLVGVEANDKRARSR
jgi:hypothetical protein